MKNKTWTILNSYWPNRKTIKANRKELIKIMKQYKLIGFETLVFDEDNNIVAYMESGKTRFFWG